MSRSYTSSPPQAPPWRVEGLLYFTFTFTYIQRHIFTSLVLKGFYAAALSNTLPGFVFLNYLPRTGLPISFWDDL
jgi:hypothetical protein